MNNRDALEQRLQLNMGDKTKSDMQRTAAEAALALKLLRANVFKLERRAVCAENKLATAEAELATARRDAERWRKLRSRPSRYPTTFPFVDVVYETHRGTSDDYRDSALDSLIDDMPALSTAGTTERGGLARGVGT